MYIEAMRDLIHQIKKTYQMAEEEGSSEVMRNAAFLSGLQAVTYLLPLIVFPYLFRTIGPGKFGLISFAQAFIQYFVILTDYAFSISATKDVSLVRENKEKVAEIFSAVMTAKLLLLIVSGIMLTLIITFIPKFREDWLLYALGFGAVIGNALFPSWLFQGIEKMKYIARVKSLGEFAFAIAIFCFIHGPADYLRIPLLYSVVYLATGTIGMIIVFRRLKLPLPFPRYKTVRRELKAGRNVFLSIVAINAYTTSRIFVVGLLTSNTLTGYYSIAEKIAAIAQTFPLASFSQAIFPRMSRIFLKSRSTAFSLMQQVQTITVRLSFLTLPFIILFAPLIVRLICGGDYPVTVLTLRLLILAVFFVSWNAFRVQFLLVCGRTKTYAQIHIIMASIGLPLLILMVYGFSYAGAAIATVIIEGGIFTLTYHRISRLKFS